MKAMASLKKMWQGAVARVIQRKPHFDFITAHYIVIISGVILGSILMYASRGADIVYIDALMFASGANTQAGLNPVDLNKLNTFQQIVMYIIPMLTNPITLHGSVVVLRLYWFEKRFRTVVKDAMKRRTTITKSRSKARGDDAPDLEEGVNGRDITVVPRQSDRSPRVTNDGVLLEDDPHLPKAVPSSDGSDSTNVSDGHGQHFEGLTAPAVATESEMTNEGTGLQQAVTFADTVKRSDGVEDDPINYLRAHPFDNAEHIAILERQRAQDNEVLRIPGPRDAERGMCPRRLDDGEDNEESNPLSNVRTRDSRVRSSTLNSRHIPRNPTITIEEPHRPKLERAEENAAAATGTMDALRMRKPRALNSTGQHKTHEDGDERRGRSTTRAVRTRTIDTIRSALTRDKMDDMPYLSYTPTMGRNSNFVGLTLEQREELGGIEYRSLRTLMFILLIYFWGFQVLSVTFLLPYILHKPKYGDVVSEAGVSRTWWGFFTASGAFMDLGFALTPDSMASFATSDYVLMIMWFFIIIGNTGFPVMLRFLIWASAKIVPKGSGLWEELRFLLDHPRRCFTLLFPSAANWWLFWILVILNVVDLVFFIILDLNSAVVEALPVHTRVVNGLFQAASTRTAGYASLPLSGLHPAMPVLYMLMMYIGVFPIAISIRKTNVYEEKSLGVYHDKKNDDEEGAGKEEPNTVSYVSTHLRRQLSFDLWYVFLGFFLLAITEGGKLKRNDFSMFDILFELVSAYGTVGLSMGARGVNTSLCSQFSTLGKLIIIAMEIRGRHRGLPYGLDRAVILPSESRFKNVVDSEVQSTTDFPRTNTGASRPGSNHGQGRSMSRDRNSRIITKMLHPGPVVPPNVVHSHHRRTTSSGSEALSHAFTNVSRRPQSFHTAVDEDTDEERDNLAPLRSTESNRIAPPRRADTLPANLPSNSAW